MEYITAPYADKKDYLRSRRIRRLSKRVRINIRTLDNIPVWCNLVVRNGCTARYKGGYLTPIQRHRFTSIQEVNDFLHTDGRKGLYQITRFSDWWTVTECVQMPTKKQALERAAKSLFGWAYGWREDKDIYYSGL
jgi:hypothetical protein